MCFPVVLYGRETWPLTLREEYRLRVFVKNVLRIIFQLKGDEVTEIWRKLHNEEFRNLYSSPNIIRMIKLMRMRRTGHVACIGEKWNALTYLRMMMTICYDDNVSDE
jgi:hypothetical protein